MVFILYFNQISILVITYSILWNEAVDFQGSLYYCLFIHILLRPINRKSKSNKQPKLTPSSFPLYFISLCTHVFGTAQETHFTCSSQIAKPQGGARP